MNKIGIWLKAMRVPFFTASVIPVIVGGCVAWWQTGQFHWGLFVLTLIGMMAVHAGSNMINDYFDHLTENDDRNTEFSMFSGGSRVIQEGLVSAKAERNAALIAFALGGGIGLYLAYMRGWEILAIGVAGMFLAYFYTSPAVCIVATGLGELAIALGFGVLPVLGAYFVQCRTFSWEAFWLSLPVSSLIAAVLYINEFPDFNSDRAVQKNTLVVRLGKRNALWGYLFLMLFPYIVIVAGVLSKALPYPTLLVLLTLPLAIKALANAWKNYGETPKLLPSNGLTIVTHLTTGILLAAGTVISRIIA